MIDQMLLNLSSWLTQVRDKNSLLMIVVFRGYFLWSFLFKEGRVTSRTTLGASSNVPDEVTLMNVCFVPRLDKAIVMC